MQDSLFLIYRMLLPTRSPDPHLEHRGDQHQKCLRYYPTYPALEGAFQRGVRSRTFKFIIAFFGGRTYRIRVGEAYHITNRTNNIGVLQGSGLSPAVYNLAI